jgi:hypothetical protein
MNKKMLTVLIVIAAVVAGVATIVLRTGSDVDNQIGDARQEASVMAVADSLVLAFGDLQINDTSFQPTRLTDDQLAGHIDTAREKAVASLSDSADEGAADRIRAVTFTQRSGNTFQLVSGDGSASATVTLDDDSAAGVYYRLDRLADN